MIFSSFHFKNFRSLEDIHIKDIGQVNLLVGKNNSGKSTILEGIFLLCGAMNPNVIADLHSHRDLLLMQDDEFRLFFRNQSFENDIYLNSELGNREKRELKISPLYSNTIDANIMDDKSRIPSGKTNLAPGIGGIHIELSHKNKKENYQLSLKNLLTTILTRGNIINAAFLSPKSITNQLVNSLEDIFINKRIKNIISVLKTIEPSLEDIRIGAHGRVYMDIGIEKMMPINIMGDGIRKILSVIVSISNMQNGVVLLDEIENGIHYSSLHIFWRAILAAAKEFNVQLFITTHSYECIKAYTEESANSSLSQDELKLLKIDKNESEHKVISFSLEEMKSGIENSLEVR